MGLAHDPHKEHTMRISLSIDKLRVTDSNGNILIGLNNMQYTNEFEPGDVGAVVTGLIAALKAAQDAGLKL
jgi:hypothetical protein